MFNPFKKKNSFVPMQSPRPQESSPPKQNKKPKKEDGKCQVKVKRDKEGRVKEYETSEGCSRQEREEIAKNIFNGKYDEVKEIAE